MRIGVYAIVASLLVGCAGRGDRAWGPSDNPATTGAAAAWTGVYASPAEIRGFERMVLAISEQEDSTVIVRGEHVTDTGPGNPALNRIVPSVAPIIGENLYLPHPIIVGEKNALVVMMRFDRYVRRTIRGQAVLMHSDAARLYDEEGKLWDYGILIRVRDAVGEFVSLDTMEFPSIRLLQDNPSKPWRDPFIYGP